MMPNERVTVLADADAVASHAAEVIARCAQNAVQRRGQFLCAVSGGSTPIRMFEALARLDVPWKQVHLFQVDERIAPPGDAARNLTALEEHLLSRVTIPRDQVHRMPVEAEDPVSAAAHYSHTLECVAGRPPILDLVHLGLGSDGHTASLVPGDPVLGATAAVAISAPYAGYRRMTMTFPLLAHARTILWVVTGPAKRAMLERLLQGDATIPAGRVPRDVAQLVTDVPLGGTTPVV